MLKILYQLTKRRFYSQWELWKVIQDNCNASIFWFKDFRRLLSNLYAVTLIFHESTWFSFPPEKGWAKFSPYIYQNWQLYWTKQENSLVSDTSQSVLVLGVPGSSTISLHSVTYEAKQSLYFSHYFLIYEKYVSLCIKLLFTFMRNAKKMKFMEPQLTCLIVLVDWPKIVSTCKSVSYPLEV